MPDHTYENLDKLNIPELEKGHVDYPEINLYSVLNEKIKPLGCQKLNDACSLFT